jgi:hypothetical protein
MLEQLDHIAERIAAVGKARRRGAEKRSVELDPGGLELGEIRLRVVGRERKVRNALTVHGPLGVAGLG